MKQGLVNVLLFLVAATLVAVLFPLALVAKVVFAILQRRFDWSWFKRLALSFDQMGNVLGDDLFSFLFIKNDHIKPFGDEDETVSSVLGKNYQEKNLTFLGELLRRILHMIDPNHSVKSIEET